MNTEIEENIHLHRSQLISSVERKKVHILKELSAEIDDIEVIICSLAKQISDELRAFFVNEDKNVEESSQTALNSLMILKKSEENVEKVRKAFSDFQQSTHQILKSSKRNEVELSSDSALNKSDLNTTKKIMTANKKNKLG